MYFQKFCQLGLCLFAVFVVGTVEAAKKGTMKKPNFVNGDSIPQGATHDWNLGATGARGWIYSHKMETSSAREIYITKVDARSPAARVLKVGDVILGVSGKPFAYDPRIELGKALTVAESNEGKGDLSLMRWRDGKRESVVIKLQVLGGYSATAPYTCAKSQRIIKQGCDAIIKRMKSPNYSKQNPIPRALNALALLASGDPQYMPAIKKEVQWASDFSATAMATWYYGYVMMLLAEYHMVTGDQSVLSGLRRLALEAANGQSIVGSWGHKFAGDDGRLVGYGMMNAPGVTLTTALVLAREAGVKAPEVDRAIERSLKLLRFYNGKGAIPYGDHDPWIQTHDDNGKNGMAAVLFGLLGENNAAEYFSRMSLASHGAERDGGHTGNFWNMTWAMPGVMQSGPNATGAWMKEFGSWYYDLARRWDGTFAHQGPPAMKPDSTRNWDATGSYVLAYAMSEKKIMLTGKKPTQVPELSASDALSVIIDGRGWSNGNRNAAYDRLSVELLFERLTSWSPVVRERAAMALARRKGISSPVPHLIKMLELPSVIAREGACRALIHLRGKAEPAIPALRENLKHEDLWVRVKSAEALASIGAKAMHVVPELLTMLIKGPTKADPRGMEQRYLSSTLFHRRDGMLGRSLKGVDRDMLYQAVRAGLKNEDGRARGLYSTVYNQLSYDEIKPLLPAIYEAVKTPSASGIMFADGIRMAGLKILAKYKIREGMPLCFELLGLDRWGKKGRVMSCLQALEGYGSAAKPMLPKLKKLEKDLMRHRESKNFKAHLDLIRKMMKHLETTNEDVLLRSID